MTDFQIPPIDVRDHAAEAVVICAGCGCSLCMGQKFRSMILTSNNTHLTCHAKRQCLIDAARGVRHSIARLEAMAIVRYLITAEQREKAWLS